MHPAVERAQPTLAPRVQGGILGSALALFALLLAATAGQGWRMPTLAALGFLIGATLYHSAFGFTAAYRRLILQRDVAGVQAQLAMVALATVLFAPVLAAGSIFGREVVGAVAPVGLQVAVGASMFGIGMQLAGGCGSGTLYTAGGGNPRMIVVLAAFCAGSFRASLDTERWENLPSWSAIALGEALGWPIAVIVQLAVVAVLWIALGRFARGQAPFAASAAPGGARILSGPWLLVAGALLLALLNFLVLIVAGHPWNITWAFALWGAKFALLFGWDPGATSFWNAEFQRSALGSGVLQDVTSVTDIGIVVGALGAAAAAGRFAPQLALPWRPAAAAVIGGLAMGYGARIAYGCNIGAFFSGVASTSLHGWLWILAALAGTSLGVRMRPWFGLRN